MCLQGHKLLTANSSTMSCLEVVPAPPQTATAQANKAAKSATDSHCPLHPGRSSSWSVDIDISCNDNCLDVVAGVKTSSSKQQYHVAYRGGAITARSSHRSGHSPSHSGWRDGAVPAQWLGGAQAAYVLQDAGQDHWSAQPFTFSQSSETGFLATMPGCCYLHSPLMHDFMFQCLDQVLHYGKFSC